MEGLRKAPNAVYALVQTALVQDEALKRAHDRIQELEAAVERAGRTGSKSGGFLDLMRDAIFGQGQSQSRGSVPTVRAPEGGGSRPAWNTRPGAAADAGGLRPAGLWPAALRAAARPGPGTASRRILRCPAGGGGGGSFLGTAAAAAAGVVGGSLLVASIRGMMGGGSPPGAWRHAGGLRRR